LVFIQNYATYEFTVTASVKALLSNLNALALTVQVVRPELQALVLDADFCSVIQGSSRRTWENRIDLLRRSRCGEVAAVHDGLFPKDGSQFRPPQLDLLWDMFGFSSPVLPHPRLRQTIIEMVENRNKIAHGNEPPENVGRRYTIADLERRIDDTEQICTHVATTFLQYLSEANAFR